MTYLPDTFLWGLPPPKTKTCFAPSRTAGVAINTLDHRSAAFFASPQTLRHSADNQDRAGQSGKDSSGSYGSYTSNRRTSGRTYAEKRWHRSWSESFCHTEKARRGHLTSWICFQYCNAFMAAAYHACLHYLVELVTGSVSVRCSDLPCPVAITATSNMDASSPS